MYEEYLDADPPEEDVRLVGMWGRALQLSLDSDMTDVLLDPGDVGADGEWAVYVHRGWSGERPGRYASFRAFMEDMYQEFYRLGGDHSGFENRVTRDLDSRVEEARLACLRGELDAALDVFREAGNSAGPGPAYWRHSCGPCSAKAAAGCRSTRAWTIRCTRVRCCP